MSEMMPVRALRAVDHLRQILLAARLSQPGCIASRARPSRPLSGVRISWLVLARKALLARLAASAASRASASACCVWRRSVMSSAVQMVPPPIRLLGSTDCACRRAQNSVPSRRLSCASHRGSRASGAACRWPRGAGAGTRAGSGPAR